ncbi:hypothetical protein Pcinc_026524 [Petrolisthes cinctipes]|uniref:Uncharacterized protein n=1 Tax=Petrolisthes cinctipes TaxID=88211 RepID=A0AAE1F6C3_PETCI|nr:hypothetical protein Pcinc_026524 [Petrolisthes cinctipes]
MDDGDKSSEVFKLNSTLHALQNPCLQHQTHPRVRKPSSIILSPARNTSIVHSMYTKRREEECGMEKEGIAKKGDGREGTVKEGDGMVKEGDGMVKEGDGREGTVKEGDGMVKEIMDGKVNAGENEGMESRKGPLSVKGQKISLDEGRWRN